MNEKQKQLLEAAIDLFAKEGFWNTPTSRIARHAGVANGTLFNYFESKDVLIDAVYTQLKQEWLGHIMDDFPHNESFKARVEHVWFRFIDWGVRHPVRYSLMMQLKLSDLVSAEAQQKQEKELAFLYDMVEQAIQNGEVVDVSAEYLGRIFYAQLDAAVQHATANKLQDMTLVRHIHQGFEIFWKGVS